MEDQDVVAIGWTGPGSTEAVPVLKPEIVEKLLARLGRREKVKRLAAEYGVDRKTIRAWRARGRDQPRVRRPRKSMLHAHATWRKDSSTTLSGILFSPSAFPNVSNRWRSATTTTTTTTLHRFVYDTTRLGRLVADTAGDGITNFEYDSAGNTRFSYRVVFPNVPSAMREDRASYYGADGRLRAADFRQLLNTPNNAGPTVMAFEEYRYDALGRRVVVRARRQCDFVSDRPKRQCNLDLVRRTVWDGTQELAEIQMPNGAVNGQVNQTERDTGFVAIPPFTLTQDPQYFDPNPYFGRVLYTHGLALDRPLSITRVEYTDDPQATSGSGGQGPSRWAPLSIVPVWNDRGQADLFYFADTNSAPYCRTVSGNQRCVRGSFPFAWFAYDRASSPPREWHGTLVEDKADDAGTLYRRERYYEPTTGRFTQEDPIGLAGGMNLYGFASGDPVNFADPFGLWPWPDFDRLFERAHNWLTKTDDGQFVVAVLCLSGCVGTNPEAQAELDAAQAKFPLLVMGTKGSLPRLKSSAFGPKIGDDILRNGVPRNWSLGDSEDAIVDYQTSIASRKAELAAFDAVGGGSATQRLAHARRISQEEAFLRSLETAQRNRR